MDYILENIKINNSTKTNIKNKLINIFSNFNLYKNKKLNILLITLACNGFGDYVFAIKFYNYLQNWYNCNIDIATTGKNKFLQLNANLNIIEFEYNKKSECRRLSNLKFNNPKIYDLIFLAPLQADYFVNLQDIKNIFNYSNKFNTYVLSEYNSPKDNYDFATGIGDKRCGLLFNDIIVNKNNLPNNLRNNNYAVIYIADVENEYKCYMGFIELLLKKYNYKNFNIIVPPFISIELLYYINQLLKINNYYDVINIINNDTNKQIIINSTNKQSKVLNILGNVYPLDYNKMNNLIYYSVKDILLTGDQSITDCLSLCKQYDINKNIFYQSVGWKINFRHQLSKLLPNKFLKYKTTTCGNLLAIKYKSNYKKFYNNWDFRILAKPKLDGIINYTIYKKIYPSVKNFENTLLSCKSDNCIKKSL